MTFDVEIYLKDLSHRQCSPINVVFKYFKKFSSRCVLKLIKYHGIKTETRFPKVRCSHSKSFGCLRLFHWVYN